MTHGSLFSGIGGFDLASEWMGWENVFHCENNPFCNKILNYYWPKAITYGDITRTDFARHKRQIDLISGGFPCQPYSLAGKRKGNEDNRHLWPSMLSAIKAIQPSWIVAENVSGLINWGNELVFQQIQADLEAEGFEVFPPIILPACSQEAPHERPRVWIVAYSKSNRQNGSGRFEQSRSSETESEGQENKREWIRHDIGRNGQEGIITNPNKQGLSERLYGGVASIQSQVEPCQGSEFARTHPKTDWSEFPTQSPIFPGNDGFPNGLDGITISQWRTESIKGAGNAIVPHIAYELFKIIEKLHNEQAQSHR